MDSEPEIKEKRIRKISPLYYSRKDIIDAIFKFSKNREISPRYFQGFGKRPDSLQYPSDITSLIKRGATSFHCSEELWSEPMELSTEMSKEQLNELRTGWDLIIDIDCPWFYYSKKAAQAIIKAMEYKGVKNMGIKYSGSKGFHIIIPWKAFPKEISEIKTSSMFPEWPKAVVNYLKYLSRPILEQSIKDSLKDFKEQEGFTGIKCETCNNLASKNYEINLTCPSCAPPYIETFKTSNENYKEKKCPVCKSILKQIEKKQFYFCSHCNINSIENPGNFNEGIISTDIFKILGLDVLLVSSRHLFRMPYSLHEKTALASVVIEKEKLENFSMKDAAPLNVKVLNFIPNTEKDEAKNLLLQAIDFDKSQELEKPKIKIKYGEFSYEGGKKDFELPSIENIKEENFPPVIQKILEGMVDGKKRSLFILINFFRSLGLSIEELEEKLVSWNKLNKPPLKKGYIEAQLKWHSHNKPVLPPNFTNPIYKELGIYESDFLSEKVKNPVNYVIRKSLMQRKNSTKKK